MLVGDSDLVNYTRDSLKRIAENEMLHERMPLEPLGCINSFFFKELFIKHVRGFEDLAFKTFLVSGIADTFHFEMPYHLNY